jgi:type IV pilus assembly protein PilX
MHAKHPRPRHRTRLQPRAQTRQRGVVMLFGLLALVIMMIGAVAMIRSMNTQLFNAGNLGFKRDLTNQGERATALVLKALGGTGALSQETARQGDLASSNYSATLLDSNDQGLPKVLIGTDTAFAAVGTASDIIDSAQGIEVRYVLDRMCAKTGAADPSFCTMDTSGTPTGASATQLDGAEHTGANGLVGAVAAQVVYRLSIRVKGPRRTLAFFQSTLTL